MPRLMSSQNHFFDFLHELPCLFFLLFAFEYLTISWHALYLTHPLPTEGFDELGNKKIFLFKIMYLCINRLAGIVSIAQEYLILRIIQRTSMLLRSLCSLECA